MPVTGVNPKRKPLAQLVGTTCALIAPAALANTVFVTNCGDAGIGTLRQSVTPVAANSGDTIDLSQCVGSVISLSTGEILITQKDLTLHAPAAGVVIKYNGSNHGRVFNHSGTGTLRLDNLTVALGYTYVNGNARGGCIYSKGNVYLASSKVEECRARSKGQFTTAYGAGIFANGTLRTVDSVIGNNTAQAFASAGAAAYVVGGATLVRSTVSGNTVIGDATGAGILSRGNVVIMYSTVSGNTGATQGGGLAILGSSLTMANSTVSSNDSFLAAGVYTSDTDVTVQNSTIAFNTAAAGKSVDYMAPGLAVKNFARDVTVSLQSSILSNNTYGAKENDLSRQSGNGHIITLSGADNLIRAASTALPSTGLITGPTACPRLGVLRNNGGSTRTHALLSHSAAIDSGNNANNVPGSSGPAVFDQRVSSYVRVSGPSGATNPRADIGAYEVQQNDIVFNADFEGCP